MKPSPFSPRYRCRHREAHARRRHSRPGNSHPQLHIVRAPLLWVGQSSAPTTLPSYFVVYICGALVVFVFYSPSPLVELFLFRNSVHLSLELCFFFSFLNKPESPPHLHRLQPDVVRGSRQQRQLLQPAQPGEFTRDTVASSRVFGCVGSLGCVVLRFCSRWNGEKPRHFFSTFSRWEAVGGPYYIDVPQLSSTCIRHISNNVVRDCFQFGRDCL